MGWLSDGRVAQRGAPPGTVAIPAAAVGIPAYTRVRLEHLVNSRTGDLHAVYLPEGSILPETFVDAREIIGRVVVSDKLAGQLFSENDFFPPGTREGIVAGIPSGKRAIRIDARKVNGIVGLSRGDRFDLVATLDLRRSGRNNPVVVQGAAQTNLGALGSSVQSSLVVEDGAVVQPLQTRSIPGRGWTASEAVEPPHRPPPPRTTAPKSPEHRDWSGLPPGQPRDCFCLTASNQVWLPDQTGRLAKAPRCR